MVGPKSSTLFHFTRSLDNLKGILATGFHPRYCLEDTRWLEIPFTAYPMVCFCDIPISRISEHTAFYGSYGMGMTKEWGLKNSLVPLIYTPNSGPIPKLVSYILSMTKEQADELRRAASELEGHFQNIITIAKPVSGQMMVGGELVEKDFYQENEWRFVPQDFDVAFHDDIEERRGQLNKAAATHRLEFSPQDVRYIFVKSESEIPEIFDFIHNNLGHWPHNDIKILTSRITSLDTLAKDV